MKCKECGKEINKEQERLEWNTKYPDGPDYDEMGFQISMICADCLKKHGEAFANELKSHNL